MPPTRQSNANILAGALRPVRWRIQSTKHFKPNFTEALGAAIAAYPEAHVGVGDAGIVLHPARSPVVRIAAVG